MSIFVAVISPRPYEGEDIGPVLMRFGGAVVEMEGRMSFMRGENCGHHLTVARLSPTTPVDSRDMIVFVEYPPADIEMSQIISEMRTALAFQSEARRISLRPAENGMAFIMHDINEAKMTEAFVESSRALMRVVK